MSHSVIPIPNENAPLEPATWCYQCYTDGRYWPVILQLDMNLKHIFWEPVRTQFWPKCPVFLIWSNWGEFSVNNWKKNHTQKMLHPYEYNIDIFSRKKWGRGIKTAFVRLSEWFYFTIPHQFMFNSFNSVTCLHSVLTWNSQFQQSLMFIDIITSLSFCLISALRKAEVYDLSTVGDFMLQKNIH